jgi:uncharacterized Zn finger protein (UPF0148 family)
MDEKNKIFICPKCGAAGFSGDTDASCFNCGHPWMVHTGYDAEQWENLSAEQKNAAIDNAKKRLSDYPEEDRAKPSGWIKFLKTVAMIWMVVSMLGSIIYGLIVAIKYERVGLGLLTIAVGCILTLVIAASVMVFLEMAEDVRGIRGILERRK